MKAYLVCDDDLGCVVRLAETASKARWAGACEMGVIWYPYHEFDNVTCLSVRRIPAYDGDDPDAAHRRYWTDHDGETGEPVGDKGEDTP